MPAHNSAIEIEPALLEEARKVAASHGLELDELVNLAVAEKVSAVITEDFFRERSRNGDVGRAKAILARAGIGNDPMPGDETD